MKLKFFQTVWESRCLMGLSFSLKNLSTSRIEDGKAIHILALSEMNLFLARIPWPTVNLARGTCKKSTQPVILSEATGTQNEKKPCRCGCMFRPDSGWKCTGGISQPDSKAATSIPFNSYMCWGLNFHCFPMVGMVINLIVGVYIPIIRIPIKGGMTIPNIRSLDCGTYPMCL